MTLDEIKQAVRDGKTVCCDSPAYQVRRHELRGGKEQWLIKFIHSDYCIGLTHQDGTTLNGREFFIQDAPQAPAGEHQSTTA